MRCTTRVLEGLLVLALAGAPADVRAQSPTDPAHPSMPWSGITTPHGQLIRFVYVPPQIVTLQYLVPVEAEAPAPPPPEPSEKEPAVAGPVEPAAPATEQPAPTALRVVQQQVTIPGYHVRETTVGYHYPERWTIEPAGPNVYRWQRIPPQFVPK
jgi:hypothetical protein